MIQTYYKHSNAAMITTDEPTHAFKELQYERTEDGRRPVLVYLPEIFFWPSARIYAVDGSVVKYIGSATFEGM